ncbi:MAG: phosphoribosylglycinamide formyltransferase [Ktedonobacteraceae bacterium]
MSSGSYESFEWKITRKKRTEGEEDEAGEQPEKVLRLGVLISGSGSNLQALIDAIEGKKLSGVEIALVVSNNARAPGVQRALKHNVPIIYLPWIQRETSEAQLIALLRLFEIDLIVLAGWMRILSGAFLQQFPQRVINLHPALLPDDGTGSTYTTKDGMVIPVFRGLHAIKQALDAGVRVTGSTVHYVTPEVDAGPVICREEVAIEEGDTQESLHERLKRIEHQLVVEAARILRAREM